jgi:hypothetical protein
MGLFDPDPRPTLPGRIRRLLSSQAERIWLLDKVIHTLHRIALIVGAVVLVGFVKSAWIPTVLHDIAIILFIVYITFWIIFFLARQLTSPAEAPIGIDERIFAGADLRGLHSGDLRLVAEEGKDPQDVGRDLDKAVELCHASLGFEHTGFTWTARRDLYQQWISANSRSIVLITPTFGQARGQAVGVTIVIPLKPNALEFIQSRNGGALKLNRSHIFDCDRKEIRTLLVDTLLLDDQWIPAYGTLALKALFQHVAMFYNPRYWNKTEIYCAIYQAGLIGRSLTRMRKLVIKRGFAESGRTAEGETLFRLPVGVLRADPRLKERYDLYTALVRQYAEIWKHYRTRPGQG